MNGKGKGKGSGWHGEPRRHSMARRGLTTPTGVKFGKMLAKGQKIDSEEDIAKALDEILVRNVWTNWGDVNFAEHGGTAVKWDGRWVEVEEVSILNDSFSDRELIEYLLRTTHMSREEAEDHVKNEGPVYLVQSKSMNIDDLIEMFEDEGLTSYGDLKTPKDLSTKLNWGLTSIISYYGGDNEGITWTTLDDTYLGDL